MSNAISTINDKIPAILRNQDLSDLGGDLISGAEGGFAVLSIRGGRFRVKQGGEETVVSNDEGDAKSSIEVILVKSSSNLSKLYYAKDYEEGDDATPDCFSTDGQKPSDEASNPQSSTCAACPHNKWGSKMTPAGKKAKACSDSRRIALIPAEDPTIEPMLLRIPAASLAPLADYGKKLNAKGIPYNSVVTKLSFDDSTAYPKLMFRPSGICTDEQGAAVVEHLQGDAIERILNTNESVSEPNNAPEPDTQEDDFDRVAREAQEKRRVDEKAAKQKKAAKATPAPEAVADSPEEVEEPTEATATADADLDALLDAI